MTTYTLLKADETMKKGDLICHIWCVSRTCYMQYRAFNSPHQLLTTFSTLRERGFSFDPEVWGWNGMLVRHAIYQVRRDIYSRMKFNVYRPVVMTNPFLSSHFSSYSLLDYPPKPPREVLPLP